MAKVIMIQGTMSNAGKVLLLRVMPYIQTGRIPCGTF